MSEAAAAAAVAAQRRCQAEEEHMTSYRAEDLEGWEFKILRAATARFRDPQVFRSVLEEEARAGWELVEKFDDGRIRLKRRIRCREQDAGLDRDPYRTWVGMSQDRMTWWIVAISIALGLIALLAVVAVAR